MLSLDDTTVMNINCGNAFLDGEMFRGWFVGDIDKWCLEKGVAFSQVECGLKLQRNIEVKFAAHKTGEERDAWARAANRNTLSVLLQGSILYAFRDTDKRNIWKVMLQREGDYVMWTDTVEHIWRVRQDARIITVRWDYISRERALDK